MKPTGSFWNSRFPGIFGNSRFEGLFAKTKSPEETRAEHQAKAMHSQLQQAGYKNASVSVQVQQKSPLQQEQQKQAQKPSFIERFRAERATQIEARQQQQSQTHKHTQK
jgi:hypothetical protein